MTIKDYEKSAARTFPSQGPGETMILAAMGIGGEAGEYVDYIKKVIFHNHPLNKEQAAEELGDILWYIALAAKTLGYSLEYIMESNIEKLLLRYPEGFSERASRERRR